MSTVLGCESYQFSPQNHYSMAHSTRASVGRCIPAKKQAERVVQLFGLDWIYVIRGIFDRTRNSASDGFVEIPQTLVTADEIEEMPVIIDGIPIVSKNGDQLILGIGHLRFDGYLSLQRIILGKRSLISVSSTQKEDAEHECILRQKSKC